RTGTGKWTHHYFGWTGRVCLIRNPASIRREPWRRFVELRVGNNLRGGIARQSAVINVCSAKGSGTKNHALLVRSKERLPDVPSRGTNQGTRSTNPIGLLQPEFGISTFPIAPEY